MIDAIVDFLFFYLNCCCGLVTKNMSKLEGFFYVPEGFMDIPDNRLLWTSRNFDFPPTINIT